MDKLIQSFVNTYAWLKIFMAPFLVSGIIGVLLSLYLTAKPSSLWLFIMLGIGIMLGILFANSLHKKHGALEFIAQKDKTNFEIKPEHEETRK